MRALRRPAIVPPTLAASGIGGKKAEEHRRAREADALVELEFPEYWTYPDVRGALYAMHGWVCAYCQCALPHNDRGDADHYRPKSCNEGGVQIYWWLAYDFRNYLLACSACNSGCKGSKFPLREGSARVGYERRAGLEHEDRLLLDPVGDPVETWMRVEWRDAKQEGKVVAKMKATAGLAQDSIGYVRAEETIRFFRLNLNPNLYRERRRALELATQKHRLGDSVALRRMASRYHPFGIAVRNFLEDVDPALLPTPEEELRWLLDEIRDLLETTLDNLRATPRDSFLERRMKELCWALAVLWKDPPTGESAKSEVEQWLERHSWKQLVEKLHAKLGTPAAPPVPGSAGSKGAGDGGSVGPDQGG